MKNAKVLLRREVTENGLYLCFNLNNNDNIEYFKKNMDDIPCLIKYEMNRLQDNHESNFFLMNIELKDNYNYGDREILIGPINIMDLFDDFISKLYLILKEEMIGDIIK